MSDAVNPWQSPETPVQAEENAVQGVLTAPMIRYLKEASPWLRFIGILGYIGAILLIVTGVIMTIALLITDSSDTFGFLGVFSSLVGLVYVTFAVLAFFPARFTHRFGVKIRNYLLSGAEKDLEEALKNNRSLWRFSGILLIVYLALIPVAIIMGVVTAISSLL
jgi:hypothetical protein